MKNLGFIIFFVLNQPVSADRLIKAFGENHEKFTRTIELFGLDLKEAKKIIIRKYPKRAIFINLNPVLIGDELFFFDSGVSKAPFSRQENGIYLNLKTKETRFVKTKNKIKTQRKE